MRDNHAFSKLSVITVWQFHLQQKQDLNSPVLMCHMNKNTSMSKYKISFSRCLLFPLPDMMQMQHMDFTSVVESSNHLCSHMEEH